jgi:hypothetical protein
LDAANVIEENSGYFAAVGLQMSPVKRECVTGRKISGHVSEMETMDRCGMGQGKFEIFIRSTTAESGGRAGLLAYLTSTGENR